MYNVTTSSLAASSISSGTLGWLLTIFVSLSILLTLYALFRSFRQFLYGSVVSAALFLVYKLSRWMGVEAQNNNYTPIMTYGWIVVFIFMSIFIGFFLMKLPIIKKWEKEYARK